MKKYIKKQSSSKNLALLGGDKVIPNNFLFPRHPLIEKDDEKAIIHALYYQDLSAYEVIDGPLLNFEEKLKLFFKRNHALLLSSGTTALQTALFSLNIQKGDEIIVPVSTYSGTAAVILHHGANLKFCDIEETTGNPSLNNIKDVLSEKTRAIIVTHAWGIPIDLEIFNFFKNQKNISIIEDGARAFGSKYKDGSLVGSHGDIACFSFHELKAVSGGEGGVLLTNNREYYERAIVLGHYFRSKEKKHLHLSTLYKFHETSLGLNNKIHPLAATLAHSQFNKLENKIKISNNLWKQLVKGIKDLENITPIQIPKWVDTLSFYGFNFHWNIKNKKELPSLQTIIKALKAEGISVSTAGAPPLNKLELFKNNHDFFDGKTLNASNKYPGANKLHNNLLRLPVITQELPNIINYYIEALIKINNNSKNLYNWEQKQKDNNEQ